MGKGERRSRTYAFTCFAFRSSTLAKHVTCWSSDCKHVWKYKRSGIETIQCSHIHGTHFHAFFAFIAFPFFGAAAALAAFFAMLISAVRTGEPSGECNCHSRHLITKALWRVWDCVEQLQFTFGWHLMDWYSIRICLCNGIRIHSDMLTILGLAVGVKMNSFQKLYFWDGKCMEMTRVGVPTWSFD